MPSATSRAPCLRHRRRSGSAAAATRRLSGRRAGVMAGHPISACLPTIRSCANRRRGDGALWRESDEAAGAAGRDRPDGQFRYFRRAAVQAQQASRGNAQRFLEEVHELEARGATWIWTSLPGPTLEAYLDMLAGLAKRSLPNTTSIRDVARWKAGDCCDDSGISGVPPLRCIVLIQVGWLTGNKPTRDLSFPWHIECRCPESVIP